MNDEPIDAEPLAPLPPPARVTREAIDAARAAFEERAREAAATDEELPLDDIAIARGVTHVDLARVPDEWLYGIRVMLRADRTLVITRLESNQHRGACVELVRQLANVALPHGVECGRELPVTLGDGSVMRPDVQIYDYAGPNIPVRVPLALFEVEVHHRWTPGMIETATTYLNQLPSVVRVVFLRYFDPRGEELSVMNRLCVPAILVVFGREETGQVCAMQIQSFGNAPIDRRVFENFFDVVTRDTVSTYGAAAPWLPQHFSLANLGAELTQLRAQVHRELFYVEMPGEWASIPVDLIHEFIQAMRGWSEDRVEANRVDSNACFLEVPISDCQRSRWSPRKVFECMRIVALGASQS